MIFSQITSFFLAFIYTIASAFSFIPGSVWYGNNEYSVTDEKSILLDAAVISDTHSDSAYFNDRSKILRRAVCGISKTDYIPDALIIAGDISNASDSREYKRFEGTLRTFNKIENIIPATGNHDVRARDSYEEASGNFFEFAGFCGIETDKVYYSTEINGYEFIILGSEGQLSIEAEISDEQVEWFRNELKKAAETEKPIFIICHQAMYNSNNVYYNAGAEKNWGIGEKSGEIETVLREFAPSYGYPVFFISGHLHRTYNEYSVDSSFCENLYCVSLPSVTKTDNGGLGMAIEVYPDCVLLKARNYITMEWLRGYQYRIPLNEK